MAATQKPRRYDAALTTALRESDAQLVRQRAEAADRTVSAEVRQMVRTVLHGHADERERAARSSVRPAA